LNAMTRLQWPAMRLALPLSLLLVCGGIIAGFWWFEVNRQMTEIEQQALGNQIQDMHRLVVHTQQLLLNGNKRHIATEFSDFSSEPDLDFILLTDPEGRVLASSRLGWVGRQVDELGESRLAGMLQHARADKRDRIHLSADRMTVWAHYPMASASAEGALRPQHFAMLTGKFDLSRAKQAARYRIEQWVIVFATVVLGIAFVFWLAMYSVITRRMNRLITAANSASLGDFSVRAHLQGSDELARIGAAFDAMIERLGSETLRLQQLSRAVENMNESVLITDAQGTIQYVNSAFTRITGYTAEEAIGQNPRMLKSDQHPSEFYQAFWKRISRGKIWKGRMTDRKKDGSIFVSKVSIAPMLDAEGHITHYVAVHEDVSEQQKMEMQLLQAQKMESLGTLVGGIAHDFNNMLAGMVGNLYMARKRARDMPEITQKLERVEKLSFRAADMIKQLLAFARKDMIQFKPIDLVPFIKEAFKLSRVAIPENIQCLSDIGSEPLNVECDATQVQQMLMNLMTNARDALADSEHPTITVSLCRFEPDKAFIQDYPEAIAPAYALLSVQDNGCGIPENQQERIFEPFYTTKEVGQGSGLGLSMVFGAMKSHHGIITVQSRPGKTVFNLYFPLSASHQDSEIPEESGSWSGQSERLLLADDEPIVRDTIGEMLRIDGFVVDVAEDGQHALEVFSENPDAYAAVILDVVMPRMGGMGTAHRMREIRPEIPIVFATGYDRDHVLRGVEGMSGIAALSKPLHSATLRQTLSRLLEQQTGRAHQRARTGPTPPDGD